MSPVKSSVLVALVVAVLTAGGLHWFNQGRSREAAKLRRQNNQLRVKAVLRQNEQKRVASPALSRAAAEPVRTVPAPLSPPKAAYRHEGSATARATLQTFAWACDRADVETVQKLIYFDEAARKKLEVLRATLPPSQRQQWPTVEAMAATLFTNQVMAHPFPNADVLDELTIESLREDRAMLRLPGTSKDRTEYQQTPSGWKMVVTEELVDSYIDQSTRMPATR